MRFAPLALVMATIFLLSHTPGNAMPATLSGLDKLCHALAYFVLAASAVLAWRPQVKKNPDRPLLLLFIFCLLYAISDELHQSFIPGRYPSRADIVADGLGAAVFLGGWHLYHSHFSSTATS